MRSLLFGLGLLAGLLFAGGCSLISEEDPPEAAGTRLSGEGIRIDLPHGWHGRISERGWPWRGAAIVYFASFPLPARDDAGGSKALEAMGKNDVLVSLAEALPNAEFRSERPRLVSAGGASIGRYSIHEQLFIESGRAFLLNATFRSEPPLKHLMHSVNGALASLEVARRAGPRLQARDPAPASALARRVRLLPTPVRILQTCRRAQARAGFPILCPARLPRPFISWGRDGPPRVFAALLPLSSRGAAKAVGLSITYGAPWEPDSGSDWRVHLWRNRPCCFLHFEVFRRPDRPRYIPPSARAATLGGRRGLLKDASSYEAGSTDGDHLYWANHTRFLWRESGVAYVATLHRFGTRQETRALLGRLIRELRPAGTLG